AGRAVGCHHVATRATVHVDVDEARHQPVALDIDPLRRVGRYAVPHGRHATTGDRHPAVGRAGRWVGPGEQACSVEHQVVCGHSFLLLRTWRKSDLSWGITRCWSANP